MERCPYTGIGYTLLIISAGKLDNLGFSLLYRGSPKKVVTSSVLQFFCKCVQVLQTPGASNQASTVINQL